MCKVIAVAMQKGGCAKTSVSLNLGIGLARAGKKVLLIDNDPQGNLTASLGYEEPDDMSDTLASVMMKIINEEPIEPGYGILHHQEGIDLIPGNIELSGLEVLLANVMSRENILKEYIDQIKDQYGYIIIDCMPSLGMTTINALVAATSVLIPVPAAYLPVKGLCQLIKTISMVKKRLNKKLKILKQLLNQPGILLLHQKHLMRIFCFMRWKQLGTKNSMKIPRKKDLVLLRPVPESSKNLSLINTS